MQCWVNIIDKYPPIDERVLVSYIEPDGLYVDTDILRQSSIDNHYYFEDCNIDTVTGWMSLPEPYTGGFDEETLNHTMETLREKA